MNYLYLSLLLLPYTCFCFNISQPQESSTNGLKIEWNNSVIPASTTKSNSFTTTMKPTHNSMTPTSTDSTTISTKLTTATSTKLTTTVSSSTLASSSSSIPTSETISTVTSPSTKSPERNNLSSHERHFDGPSFCGGIVLTVGLSAIAFIAFKFFRPGRVEGDYRNLVVSPTTSTINLNSP